MLIRSLLTTRNLTIATLQRGSLSSSYGTRRFTKASRLFSASQMLLNSAKPTVSPDTQPQSQGGSPATHASSKLIFAPTGGSAESGHAVQYKQGALNSEDLASSPTEQFHK